MTGRPHDWIVVTISNLADVSSLLHSDFTFYCRPFLLKLRFPHPFVDDDRCKAVFDPLSPEGGSVLVCLPKAQSGLHFPDLDLISRLLSDRRSNDLLEMARADDGGAVAVSGMPKIQVLASEDTAVPDDTEAEGCDGDDSILMPDRVTAVAPEGEDELLSITAPRYGFDNRYSRVFLSTGNTFSEAVEVQQPDSMPRASRRSQRVAHEETTLFDGPRYLGDTIGAAEDEVAVEAMTFEPFWSKQWEIWRLTAAADSLAEGHDQEGEGGRPQSADDCFPLAAGGFHPNAIEEMTAEVIAKPFLPPDISDSSQGRRARRMLLCSLSDILFGFCYEWRMACGEPGVESASNASRLSATLSWLEDYSGNDDDVGAVVINSMRRCLCCAYLRTWAFGRKVLADVAKVLLCGKRCVLNCLLLLHRILRKTATHYILARIYIIDYCLWIQSLDNTIITDFGLRYNEALRDLTKDSVGLGLREVERQLYDSSSEDSSNDDDEESDSDSDDSSSCSEEEGLDDATSGGRGADVPSCEALTSREPARSILTGLPAESPVQALSGLLATRLTVDAAPKRRVLIEEITPGPVRHEDSDADQDDVHTKDL
jgi:protein SHQ1